LGALDAADRTYPQGGSFPILFEVPADYTAVEANSPDPTGADDWVATAPFSDPFDPFLASKTGDDSKTDVTPVADANSGMGSMFLDQSYSDGGFPPPIWFGSTPAAITDIMPSTAAFSFELTGATGHGSLTFAGEASAIDSGSPTVFTAGSTTTSISSTYLDAAIRVAAVPEPATFIPFGLGAAGVLAAGVLRNKKTNAGRRS
jgi:hypothetical protein